MFNYTIDCIKYNLKSKYFLITIMIAFLAIIISLKANPIAVSLYKGLTLFLVGFGAYSPNPMLILIAPLLVSLPVYRNFIDEKNGNMLAAVLTRTSKKKYYLSKVISNGVTGSLSIGIPLILLLVINFLIFPDLKPLNQPFQGTFSNIYESNQFLYIVILIINSMIFGFIYSNISFLIALLTKNLYMSLLLPFALYTVPNLFFVILGLYTYTPSNILVLNWAIDSNIITHAAQLIVLMIVTLFGGYYTFVLKDYDIC